MPLRNTKWRQGSIITPDSFSILNPSANDRDTYAIIISHDCDLANEMEEHVEIIAGSVIPKADSNFTHARHIRRLHLTYLQTTNSSQSTVIEVTPAKRQSIRKKEFMRTAKPEQHLHLSCEEKRVLKQWLSARYGRPAFPDSFETRLKKDKKLEKKLSHILSPANSQLVGIFFDLGEERSNELSDGFPYFLGISIVYDSTGGPAARKVAEECAHNISTLFHKTFGAPSNATKIVLDSCQAIADTHFSLAEIRKVDQWRVEYLSLRENPPEDFLPVGETPV